MTETRSFKFDPAMIFDIIGRQAGTIGKAIMEGVMNSVDAGASRCDVTVNSSSFSVVDDGRGFKGREEIEKFFETFGTRHKEGDAVYARYRMGRGQMLSFGVNTWRSGAFTMKVDIKGKGLDYDLDETPDAIHKGCAVTVKLYDRLSLGEVAATEREVKELVAYSPVPVYLNGALVSKDVEGQRWDYEDESFAILFRESGGVRVYNLGMFVRTYYEGGLGGRSAIVVSKKRLEVNFARNDVLVSQCSVWKAIRKQLDSQSAERIKKAAMSIGDRELLLRDAFAESTADMTSRIVPIFPKNYLSFRQLIQRAYRDVFVLETEDARRSELAARQTGVTVIGRRALEWSGCATLQEFLDRAFLICESRAKPKVSTVEAVTHGAEVGMTEVAEKEVTKLERCVLGALAECSTAVVQALYPEGGCRPRKIRLGESDTASGWTNGSDTIWIARSFMRDNLRSYAGATNLVALLAHEFLHTDSDADSHIHDSDFYERFHEGMLRGCMGAVSTYMRRLAALCRQNSVSPPAQLVRELDEMFRMAERANTEDALEAMSAIGT